MSVPTIALALAVAATAAGAQAEPGEPFRIFFNWAKPELTSDAKATLAEVVNAYRQQQPARLLIIGHTDRSGPAVANLRTSKQRAEAVRDYLASQGLPAAVLATAGRGEAQAIVPTKDGVREAQNRRVEIHFEGTGGTTARNSARAPLIRSDGNAAGQATLTQHAGGASLAIEAAGLPPGVHALHLHAAGRCDPPDFSSAGPHWNPTARKHGRANPEGPHLGDLPNLTVGADGRARANLPVPAGSRDDDGVALVIHAQADDDRTDPSGNSGARIACAAFPG